MKGVQRYEIFGGIALKNHAFLNNKFILNSNTSFLYNVCSNKRRTFVVQSLELTSRRGVTKNTWLIEQKQVRKTIRIFFIFRAFSKPWIR